jgi:pyruvate/2-oxoglutarate dehydrogenase complex dihydrolipoamide acyltransferase (E2) component
MQNNDRGFCTTPHEIVVRAPDFETHAGPLRIGCWFADIDDNVLAGTSLLELIVPGVRIEIDSPATGRLSRIERPSGSGIEPGSILGVIIPANSSQTDSPEPYEADSQ